MTKFIFKWASPMSWLEDYVASVDRITLKHIALHMARELSGETIQDLFQEEMDEAGYFADGKHEEE